MRQLRLSVEKVGTHKISIQVEALANGKYEVVDYFEVPKGPAEVEVGLAAVVYPDDFE